MKSYPYLTTYNPPAPVLEVRVGFPEARLTLGPFMALVDTGADGTIMPQSLLVQINAPLVDKAQLRSHWGEWRTVRLYTVDIGIADLLLPAIEVVRDDWGEEIILGRNVLNRLGLFLDGPRRRTEIKE
jgi:predicted aspartyl protease